MMQYQTEFIASTPIEKIIEFHRSASSLKAITPPFFFMSGLQSPPILAEGDEMAFTLWMGPIPVRWKARIENVSPQGFDDIQLSGPFHSWVHAHRFEAISEKETRVSDQITYQIRKHLLWGPLGLIMAIGLPILFGYRAWKTKALLEEA
jgi:ligand-binding SRPBCC domain-containing protein